MATAVKSRSPRKIEPAALPAMCAPPAPLASVPIPTKVSQLIALLEREGGASITELATSLGWLPHTTRAALTGLRKKGRDIIKSKADDVTRYHITATPGVA